MTQPTPNSPEARAAAGPPDLSASELIADIGAGASRRSRRHEAALDAIEQYDEQVNAFVLVDAEGATCRGEGVRGPVAFRGATGPGRRRTDLDQGRVVDQGMADPAGQHDDRRGRAVG